MPPPNCETNQFMFNRFITQTPQSIKLSSEMSAPLAVWIQSEAGFTAVNGTNKPNACLVKHREHDWCLYYGYVNMSF